MKCLFAILLSLVLVIAFSVVPVFATVSDEGSPEPAPPSEDQKQEEVQEPGMEDTTLELGKTLFPPFLRTADDRYLPFVGGPPASVPLPSPLLSKMAPGPGCRL